MYNWLVYLHIAATFGFLLAHGVSVSISFALQHERDPDRIRTLLELSANSYRTMYPSLLILLISGILAGFMGKWWGWGWIWVSLGLLIAITIAMSVFGSNILSLARKACGLPYMERGKIQPPVEPASTAEVEGLLARINPWLLMLIGYGGILVITWLMMFKPF